MDYLKSPAWWDACATRMLRTAAQTALSLIGTNTVGITEVNWSGVASAAALSAFVSMLMALSGLPEAAEESNGKHARKE